jgi:hypothetical protein
MPNIWAWPNDGDVSLCSLSEVLETGPVPQRYYLSPTACRGILRRAKRREKELPDALRVALEAVAGPIPLTETEEEWSKSEEPLDEEMETEESTEQGSLFLSPQALTEATMKE